MNNDLISREALKKEFEKLGYTYRVTNIIDNAPTVEYTFEEAFQKTVCEKKLYCPNKRQKGEWMNTSPYDDKGECSLCCYLSKKYYKFCPNCGAKMEGGEEE